MFKRLRRGFFVGIALSFMLCLGFASSALADPETEYKNLSEVKLTAVIVAPIGDCASGDHYVFHFAGDGTVEEDVRIVNDQPTTIVKSGGVEQDSTTIKKNDVVPEIPDVTLEGITLTDGANGNSLVQGELGQTAVQKPLSEILDGVTFPHAGVYTYEVTETSATSSPSKAYVAASQAKYLLRIYVKNAKTGSNSELGNMNLAIDYVTVERKINDYGVDAATEDGSSYKVDPTSPTTDANGKITSISRTNTLAGDEYGRNVPGFTFANAYITIAPFQVKKLYDGNHTDRTRYSTVELAVKSSDVVGSNANGSVLTYKIEGGGIDKTDNKQNNVGIEDTPQASDYMVGFNNSGWCYIKANLTEGSYIRITGEFGPLNENSKRDTLTTNGLFQGQTYYVIEDEPGDYRPTGYVYGGSDSYTDAGGNEVYIDPRKNYDENSSLWQKTENCDNSPQDDCVLPDGTSRDLSAYSLLMNGSTGANGTSIFVVNNIDENKVSTTGILINNLPYILMIGIPVIVFIALFVSKRRRNAVE